jgi:hypothetical protein
MEKVLIGNQTNHREVVFLIRSRVTLGVRFGSTESDCPCPSHVRFAPDSDRVPFGTVGDRVSNLTDHLVNESDECSTRFAVLNLTERG